MNGESLIELVRLIFFVATFVVTVHIAMVGYHWYAYTLNRTLAHVVVGSYITLAITSLTILYAISFI
jgi:hypothetical protein